MNESLRRFVVLGGGPVGWLAAAFLNRVLNRFRPGQASITVVENPSAAADASLAVGARTLPHTLRMLGIDEHALLSSLDATFSHGARFTGWLHDPRERQSGFFVPIDRAACGSDELDLGEAWIAERSLSLQSDYAHAIGIQPTLAEHARSPKVANARGYDALLAYSYQLDALELAGMLREVATRRAVRAVMGRCARARYDASGQVVAVALDNGAQLEGDFFVDCDGTLSRATAAFERAPFVPYDRTLLCDREMRLDLGAARRRTVRPYVHVRAAASGWIGECDLALRRCVSYVYSSAFISDAAAERELRAYAHAEDTAAVRCRHFRAGRPQQPWRHNTLLLGAPAGAIEPLVAPDLGFVAEVLRVFVEHLPQHRGADDALRLRANGHIRALYDDARDLTALHYCLSRREDTSFWRANRHDLSLPDSLREALELWSHRLPRAIDRPAVTGLLDHHDYRYVLAGMDRLEGLGAPYEAYVSSTAAASAFQHLERSRAQALAALPEHGAYLCGLNEPQLTLAFAS